MMLLGPVVFLSHSLFFLPIKEEIDMAGVGMEPRWVPTHRLSATPLFQEGFLGGGGACVF